ncbi:mRNA cap guanine-N7 methyltransferase [Chrysoperla carnea]|uniref:mRNA cap guanine-N7 methyltransferase n=1 Tax=Chrysoperla carnea TaxID=189513 RepID=UPI001D098261|nr:mRNA cap guanine-N7 methyltransferase [Chrysoperla carnea]
MASESDDLDTENYENQEDDLEKTLMLAAANADRRLTSTSISSEDEKTDEKPEEEIYPPIKKAKIEIAHETTSSPKCLEQPGEHSKVVAQHYNALEEKGLDERLKSRIFYMRNFNNWIKSRLINEYLTKVRDGKSYGAHTKVLDMCCGKGGDLLKWRKGNIHHLICSDIASVSVEQCESRYKYMFERNNQGYNNRQQKFTAEFIPADLTKSRLREKYQDKTIELDLVSCQFSFHYSFESLQQAECMLQNASECLKPGGYFIGTIPDANELVARQRKSGQTTFGNAIYNVTFRCDTDKPPIFGAKYDFHLEGVVDCPEFLVHFPTFVKLAAKFGLKLVSKERFDEYYNRMKDDGMPLLIKMQGLETYPPRNGEELVGLAQGDYEHAEEFINNSKYDNMKIGTLSKSEWEAATLYLTFAFQKQKRIGWTKEGKPEYAI